jgi:hypothetical protein
MTNTNSRVRRATRAVSILVAVAAAGAAAAQEREEDLSQALDSRTFLGQPTSGVVELRDGRYQSFQGGQVVVTPQGDHFAVEGGRSPIAARYAALGGPGGRLGPPIEAAPSPGSGVYPATQRFQNGSITATSPTTTTIGWWQVPAAAAFEIRRLDGFPTKVRLNWLNKGAPITFVQRTVNGGAPIIIYWGQDLAHGQFSELLDSTPTPDALNCYTVITADAQLFYTAAPPTRCAYTRDALNGIAYRVSRAQVRIKVPAAMPYFNLGTDGPVTVRLQPTPGQNLALPTGNRTRLDSSQDDFQQGSNRRYDLMTGNVASVSDITMLAVRVDGGDDLCIEEIELYVNNRSVFRRFYGSTPTTCARAVDGGSVYAASFADLRASSTWPNGTTVPFPVMEGFTAADMRSLLEAKFGNLLPVHGGHLRNGHPVHTKRVNDETLSVRMPFVANDAALGFDVACTVDFNLVIHPSEAGDNRYRMRVEADHPQCEGDWIPLLDILINVAFSVVPVWHYAVDVEVEKAMANFGGADLGQLLPGLRFCFPSEGTTGAPAPYWDGGLTICQAN